MNQIAHRFDKLARRLTADIWHGVRVTLALLENKLAKDWPIATLLVQLKGAEDLARQALQCIAEHLHILPHPIRERMDSEPGVPPGRTEPRVPVFKLFPSEPETEDTSNNPERGPCKARSTDAGSPQKDHQKTRQQNALETRLAALEDVLAYPGKHAARMARALYRAEQTGAGQHLILKSDNDLLIERMNSMIDAHLSGDGPKFARLYELVRPNWEPG